ncbi:MAG: DUF6034 family protein [Clostridium sp.]|nr:DUF6034 family protein [Clostridium sp.]
MKKTCILTMILAAALLTGCTNATAKHTAITANRQTTAAKSAVTDNHSTVASQQKKDNFDYSGISVHVNATVNPIDGDLPVIRVTPHEFTSADLKKWKNTLFADTALYEYWGADAVEAKYQYHNVGYLRGETDSDTLPAGETHDLKFRAGLYDNNYEGLMSAERAGSGSDKHYIMAMFQGEYGEPAMPYRKCSEEEAKELAVQVIRDLELDREGWQITGAFESGDKNCCRHTFTCTRYYEEVPNRSDFFSHPLSLTDAPLTESLSIDVENGAVALVHLNSPMDIVEWEQKNAATLSLDEIYAHFKEELTALDLKQEYLGALFADGINDTEYKAAQLDINISGIEEGLCCIKAEGSDTEYRLVPAWVFKGSYLVNGEKWDEDVNVLIINALDGSVIR